MGSAIAYKDCALAQIVPDATLTVNSRVTVGKTTTITGGTVAGSNLFHSFEQFSVPTGGEAYFNNDLAIKNILSRVTGSNASSIDGLIRANGTANLFLINPNGISFGPNASLNIGGAFVASTANSLVFENGVLFSATKPEAPPLLTVNVPIGLQFGKEPAAIVNAGQLRVEPGQNLSLLGGTVVSTGELEAPKGQLTVASVPPTSSVQLSSEQLSRVFSIPPPVQPATSTSPSLSQLLTSTGAASNLGVTLTDSGVKLVEGGLPVVDGDVVVRHLTAGNATLSSAKNLTFQSSQLQADGELQLLARSKVLVRDTFANPFMAQAGGNLLIEGQQVDIFALNHPQSNFFSVGNIVLRSANAVWGDARYTAGGNFRIEDYSGSLGNLLSPGDPVIRASGDVSFGSYIGASLHIFAGGSVTIPGGVVVGANDPANGIVDNVELSDGTTVSINGRIEPTLDIRAGTTAILSPEIADTNPPSGLLTPLPNLIGTPTGANITIGSITNLGGAVFLTNQYNPNPSLTGGAINVTGAITTGSLSGDGGRVTIDSRSTIALKDSLNASSSIGKGGDITLIASGDITTSNMTSLGLLGGNINLTSNGISLNDSLIISASFTPVPGVRSGDINVKTDSLSLTNGARMITATLGAASGGDLNVTASNSIQLNGTLSSSNLIDTLLATIPQLNTFLATLPPDRVQVLLNAPGSPLNSSSSALLAITAVGTGKAGDVRIEAGRVSIRDGSEISAYSFGDGDGGNLTVDAADTVELIGTSPGNIPGGFYTQSYQSGGAGDISIDTGSLLLRDGAGVSTTTFSQSQGGDLTVNASDLVELKGTTPDGQYPTLLAAGTRGSGDAGDLKVNTRRLIVQDGAGVGTTTFTQGKGGNLTVYATESVELSGVSAVNGIPGGISADTTDSGKAGDVIIDTKRLSVRDGAVISASTIGAGDGGSLVVNAEQSVELSGKSTDGIPSGLYVQGFGTGDAGNLVVTTEQLSVRDGAKVTVSTGRTEDDLARFVRGTYTFGAGLQITFPPQATGNAGEMTINALRIKLNNQATLTAATASGVGGEINLNGVQDLQLRHNSQITATALGGSGSGGNINIDTDTLVASENSDIKADAFGGPGGEVKIDVKGIFRSLDSDITASSGVGINGVVLINTPDVNPTQGLVTLPEEVVDVTGLIAQGCPVGQGIASSKFTVTGRGGLPANPKDALSSNAVQVNWVALNPEVERPGPKSTNSTNSKPEQIVEAQGWVVGANGKVILTAQAPTVTPHTWITPSGCQPNS